MSTPYADRRTVCIPDPLWKGLELIGQVTRRSISDVLRGAAEKELARYGLGILDEELVRHPSLWPGESAESTAEESKEEEEIQGGGGNPPGRRIQGGGVIATPPESMEEEAGTGAREHHCPR